MFNEKAQRYASSTRPFVPARYTPPSSNLLQTRTGRRRRVRSESSNACYEVALEPRGSALDDDTEIRLDLEERALKITIYQGRGRECEKAIESLNLSITALPELARRSRPTELRLRSNRPKKQTNPILWCSPLSYRRSPG